MNSVQKIYTIGLRQFNKIHPLFYLTVIPMLSMIYALINQAAPTTHKIYTTLDHMIPFMKIFIIPYMIWMPFIYGTLIYFYFKERKLYFNTLISYAVSVLVCYCIYLIFQTTVTRPVILETDLLSRFVLFVYQNDAPYNCFPSIHCLTSYLMYRAAKSSPFIPRKVTLGIGVLVTVIIISTFFVKQHVVLDAIGAVVLGHVVYSFIYILNEKRIAAGNRTNKELKKGQSIVG